MQPKFNTHPTSCLGPHPQVSTDFLLFSHQLREFGYILYNDLTRTQTLRQLAAASSTITHHLSSLSLPRQPEHITTPLSPIAGKPRISRYFVL
ncbi:hypothetical protein Hanom_Chr06g00530781 [Helianthus anomalus]